MDKNLAKYFKLLKEESEAVRRGASAEVSDIIEHISTLTLGLVDEGDISFAVAAVFDEDSGILSAVETLLPSRDRAAVKAKDNCLTFLAQFISRIGKRALTYAPFVKAKCIGVFRREDSRSVQAAALTPLLSILELSMQESVTLDFSLDWTWAESLLVEYRKARTSGTLRSNILMLIGYVVEKFPGLFQEEHLDIILKLCLDTLEEELHRTGNNPVYVLVTGAVKCLDSLLLWFDRTMPAGGSVENSRKIYAYVEQVIHFREDLKRYEMVKAGLRLFSRHGSLFRLRLLENSTVILKWLQSYCIHVNPQLRDAAFPAFEQFIQEIVSCITSYDQRVKNPHQTYKKIFSDALGVLDSPGSDPKLTSLAILTVGKLSPLIVKFSGKGTLLQTFYRLVAFGESPHRDTNGREESLKFSVTLVGAFAGMVVYLDDIENYTVSLIAKAVGNAFHGFPYLFPKQRYGLYASLWRLFKALYSRDAVFTVFLNNIVWSSLERSMEQGDERLSGAPLWKHYVELWSQLLVFCSTDRKGHKNNDVDKENISFSEPSETSYGNIKDAKLQASIFDCLLKSIMKAMVELNLKYRVKSLQVQELGISVREQDLATDASGNEGEGEFIEPLDPLQMRKFLNLVEFVQEFLSRDFINLFLKWVYPFGRFLVELSSQYPLISGFYKILAMSIHKAEERAYFGKLESMPIMKVTNNENEIGNPLAEDSTVGELVSQQDRDLCKILFRKYLQEVLVASRRYKLELFASCLHLCLSAPPPVMDIEFLVAPTINALKIGLRHFPLAMVAINSLENWHRLHPKKLEPWLPHIIPYFNPYLVQSDSRKVTTSGASKSISGANRFSSSGMHGKNAGVREIHATQIQMGSFEHIQLRVQKFLGKIGGQSHLLVPDINLLQVTGVGGLAWDTRSQVRFNLPFRDIKPDIWLDSLLLRIVEVSTSSSDRQAKIVASELLHAICLVMLGNTAKGPVRRKGQEHQSVHYEKIYRRLFPAILRLATDMELVTRQLFSVFVKQLIHWFTSNTQKENPDSMALLDAILDGVVDAENGSLREFCAECFAEFMRWSVRHVSTEVDNFVNIASMLHRLYTRLDHPNAYHRLGAAMASHLIYPVLRENVSIVDCHILEMLFFCIKSLRVGENDNDQIGTMKQMGKVLEGIQRLIRRNITILLKNRKDRRMFLNIEDFLDWLFLQTGRSEEKCRKKCMWLFNSMCEGLPVGSSANWFKSKVKNVHEVKDTLKVFDIGLRFPDLNSDKCTVEMLEIWMKKFVCCLQWFEWALKEQLISLNDIVLETGEEILSIGSAITVFLQNSCLDTYLNLLQPLTPSQREYHGCLRVKTILDLLTFLEVLLYVELGIKEHDVDICQERMKTLLKEDGRIHQLVPFNEPHFQNLIFEVLFHPRKIAYSSLESHSLEDLVRQTMKVIKMLSSASSVFKESFIHLLRTLLSEGKIELDINFLSFSEHVDLVNTMYILKGYQQLNQVGILLPALGKENAKSTGRKLLNSLLSLQQTCLPALQPVALEILTLAIALGVTASQLLELVLDHKRLGQSGSEKSAENGAGSQFYFNFRNVIVQQIKFSYKECLSVLLQEAVQNFTARLLLIAVLDDYIKRESITKSSFLKEYLKHVQLLNPCCYPEATLSDKLFFLEMLHKLFMLDTSCDTVLVENQPSFCLIIESYFLLFNSGQLVPDLGARKLLQRNAVMTVKSTALVIAPYFLKYAISNKFLLRLVDTVTKVVTDHLLVRETDIPQGSNERVAYIQMLQRLEDAILMANRLELLEVIFPLFQSHVKLARKKAQEILASYAEIVDENRGLACVHCLKMLNDCDKVPSLRRAVFDYMFVPMINRAPVDFIVGWYEDNIVEFKQIFEKRPDRIQSTLETEQDYLVVRICHYKMVELLFNRLDAKTIKDKITPIVSNQMLMQHATSDSRARNDPAAFPFPENIILWRELHIAAYNCLAEIVMRTQDQEKLYAVLFKDFPGKPLWQNIVDCSKVYNSLPVETSMLQTSYLAVKSMRSERSRTKRSSGVFSLSSQYIVGATLTDEPALINTFLNDSQKRSGDEVNVDVKDDDSGQAVAESVQVNDFNAIQNNGEELVEKEEIDQDDFDRHPSMGIILRLIEHCQQKFSVKLSTDGMPEWMKSLYATLANVVTPINVCLFIAKIISKARKVLASFASTWFRPYLQVILRDPDLSGGRTFHYMLRDICITILEWNLPVPPDVPVASSFVNHLISVAAHTSKLVLQANLEVIRLYMQTWKDSISLDRCTVIRYLTIGGGNPNMNDKSVGIERSVGLQLLGVMAASGISLCGSSDNFTVSEEDLCKALLLNVRCKLKNVYNAAAELIGMVLKHTEEGKLSIKEHMLLSPLKQILLSLFKDGDPGQFLNIIDKITIHFPPFLDSYAAMVLDLLPRIHGVFRVTALDILLRRSDSIPNLFNTVAPFLSKLLTHRDKIAQLKSLQLVSELIKDLPNSKLTEKVLPVLYETFTDHEDSDCRQLYFNILIFLYKEKGMDKNELLHHHLLLGLSDDSDAVKHNLQSFWHSKLSHDLCPRFLQIVNDIYDADVEDRWSQITVNLLLKLCEESVDFGRPVFDAPLSDCEFHEYTINTSWLGGTLPMTPLFSETQTQLTSLNSLDNTIQDSGGVDTKGKGQSQNIIRATYVPSQPLSLSQTQSSITGDVQAGSSLFALSQYGGNSSVDSLQHGGGTLVDKGTTPKRRILHSSLANSQAKINAINAARRRQSQLVQQSLERANKVQMMRKYRIGELPDIEIAYKDVIIPLSVLAEKDNVFSRLFLIVLCHSIYSLHPNELHKAEHELKHTVRDGIEAALKRTRNGVSFVGCAMDICLETKESWIQPKLVGSASQKSRNFHTGIRFLENTILHETAADEVHKASIKRHCGPTRRVRKEDFVVEAWLELVKLYESIGEHDVVLSIYKTSLTKAAITGHALESQLHGDSNKALQLYDNAINKFEGANTEEGIDITSVEQDLWYNQRLQCLVDLNRWQDIMEDTLLQINKEESEEPDFQILWSPAIQDPYLSLFIKGSLKLPTYSSLLSDFVQGALENGTKRELLYDEFSVELATLAVINDQFDLAKFYIQKGFDSFIKHWSSIHPLATVSKHLLVRQLQRIVELDEFVEMIPITSLRVQLQSLLLLWRNRWPAAEFDDVEAWDDVVQNRLLYIQKSQDLGRKHEDNESVSRLVAADLGSEQACIFFQAARGLMRQGSYDAAQVAETRFASNTIVLRRLVKVREALSAMVISQSWSIWRQSNSERAANLKHKILDDIWWDRVEYLLAFTEPILSMIRFTDMDKPCLGEVYDGIDSMLEKMKTIICEKEQDPEETFFKEVHAICVDRWNKMTTPLHLLAFALTPKFYSPQVLAIPNRLPPYRDLEVNDGFRKALVKLFPDPEMEDIVSIEFANFVDSNSHGSSAIRDKYKKDAHSWWYLNGCRMPHLQVLAIKVLSQGYMNQYMAVIEGSSKTEKLDFKFFRGLVKLRCLQADRESNVNAYEAIKMLQQVREYVTTTAEKPKYQTQTHWQTGLKLLKGDVTSQLARVSLNVLPVDHSSSRAVENCISLLSSAYMAYSGLLGEVATIRHLEKDNLFSPKRLAKIFLKFAFFCDELLASTKYGQWGNQVQTRIKEGNPLTGLPHSSVYPSFIVKYIMKAVRLDNSMQVQHGIARVLTMLGRYKETHSEFRVQMKGTPCWLFIAWIPQMLAVVDRDEGAILVALLEEIAQYYPQALYFPFNVSRSDFGTVGQERTKRLEILLSNPIMKGFTRALEDLTFPEQRLRNALTLLKSLLSVGDKKAAQRAFHDTFEDCLDVRCMMDENRKSGEYNLKFARDYSERILKALGENGSKLKSMDEGHLAEALNGVMINLTNSQKNLQVGKISLSSLSKWMADFDGSYSLVYDKEEHRKTVIEIPGSYSSFRKPEPISHAKLMSFDQTLQSLSSKQRPKILKMRGSDEQDYKFVVKGGEDLRLDQRIEQLFDVMNTVLFRDSSCARRKLSLRTYAVIPISKQCGIMQFVEGTTVLEDVIKDGLVHRLPNTGQQASRQGRNTPVDLLSHMRGQYHEWIGKKGASKNVSESYRNMYRNVRADEVIQKMNALISQLPWDALKVGISRLATSAESFLALRSQFVRSLSVLSICGYIAGVGDRHLSNFLMDTKNGMLVPIDFGYSFGTGVILLPVPELIPFRLTSQFINILLPLDSIGLLRNDMVRTLSALHANREIISAILDVFVNEPLVDWKNEAMKTAALQQPEFSEGDSESQPRQVSSHEQQHVALKIENAHRKLNFWNPADITISELHSSVHFNKPYLSDLEKIVRGNPEHNVRARIQRIVCESIQEQVDCLIDQATDLNLLGRIWVGWQPWL